MPILLLSILYNAFYAPVSSFTDSATMFMLGDKKELYGRVRLGGTLGFGIAAARGRRILFRTMASEVCLLGRRAAIVSGAAGQPEIGFWPGAHRRGDQAGSCAHCWSIARWILFLTLALAGGFALAANSTHLFPFLKELGTTESHDGAGAHDRHAV